MDIRRRRLPMRQVPMHFQFKKSLILVKNIQPSQIIVDEITEPVPAPANTEKIYSIEQIEQQVKLNQQIVAEWDIKLELMRTQEIEMRRTDVVRELNTLIEIWNNANP
jgi:hypothetical protein